MGAAQAIVAHDQLLQHGSAEPGPENPGRLSLGGGRYATEIEKRGRRNLVEFHGRGVWQSRFQGLLEIVSFG